VEKMSDQSFLERKEAALHAAKAQGIVDVVQASNGSGVSIEALEQATKLTEKHASTLYKKIKERRQTQQ
jgi:hypothetical protein